AGHQLEQHAPLKEYVRIATTVLLPDGRRAVGTVMGSPALGSIKAGHPFQGEVAVLGTQYIPATSLSKTPRVKPSAPTSLDTRSDARATTQCRLMTQGRQPRSGCCSMEVSYVARSRVRGRLCRDPGAFHYRLSLGG